MNPDLGNCFLHHITAPNHRRKTENILKKWGAYKITFWTSFPEHNNLFQINFSKCIIFSSGFFYPKWDFKFFFWIFISKTQKYLLDLFLRNTLFSIPDFHFRIKGYFWNFWNYVGCRFKSVGCREHLPQIYLVKAVQILKVGSTVKLIG